MSSGKAPGREARAPPPRVRAKRGYHHGDLRAQLVRAARRLVARDGAAGFRVADACALAGVSTAAPYRHFRDRDAILDAVAADGFGTLARATSSAAAEHARGTLDAIVAIGGEYVAFARAEPELFRLMFERAPGERERSEGGPRGRAAKKGGKGTPGARAAIADLARARAGHAAASDAHEACGAAASGAAALGDDERAAAGEIAYGVLIAEVAACLERPPDDPTVLRTALSLWTFVHGLSCLIIDGMTEVSRVELEVAPMLRAASASLLGAFVD